MDKGQAKLVLPPNPYLLPAGKKLTLVNSQDKEIGEIILKEQTNVMMPFSQENEAGVMTHYKMTFCDPVRRIFCVREDRGGF